MGQDMLHPLFSLISQRPETATIEAASAVPKPSLADASGVAGAGGVGGGGEDVGSGGIYIGLDGPQVPHIAILAVLAPPSQDGTPGVTAWATGIPMNYRREILADDAWFQNRIRRRQAAEAAQTTQKTQKVT